MGPAAGSCSPESAVTASSMSVCPERPGLDVPQPTYSAIFRSSMDDMIVIITEQPRTSGIFRFSDFRPPESQAEEVTRPSPSSARLFYLFSPAQMNCGTLFGVMISKAGITLR